MQEPITRESIISAFGPILARDLLACMPSLSDADIEALTYQIAQEMAEETCPVR
jgi:hypothetical protein